jgi:hypothetical protein
VDGTWLSRSKQDPSLEGRFRLQIVGDSCICIERKGKDELEIACRMTKADGTVRIERPNDEKVLNFLFRPTLAEEILERSPESSYFLLLEDGDKLSGTWNALLAKTYGTPHLKELTRISIECEFVRIDEQ